MFKVIVGPAVAAGVSFVGAVRWHNDRHEKLRTDMLATVDAKVLERNARLENLRAELLAQIAKIDRDTAKANNEVSALRLEMVRDYSTRRDMETALEKAMTSLQQQVYRVETMVDKLLGQLGRGLNP